MGNSSRVHEGMVEQGTALTEIDGALTRAAEGTGQVVVLTGPRGSGKSSLVAAGSARAADAGHIVLVARGNHLEANAPFGVVCQLFEPPLADLDPRARRRLFSGHAAPASTLLGPDGPPPGTPSTATDFNRLHGLFWLTANWAACRPVFLAIDDAHLADPESLSFLNYLINRIDNLPIVVAVAGPPRSPALASTSPLIHFTSHPTSTEVEPEPLGVSAVSQIVRKREWYPDADHEFCRRCADASVGNPLRLVQLLTELRNRRVVPDDLTDTDVSAVADEAWAEGLAGELHLFPAPALALAEAATILGDESRLDWAAEAAELDPTAAEAVATTLSIAGVMPLTGPTTIADPRISSAIDQMMSPIRRGKLHAKAARLLDHHGVGVDKVARHLVVSAPAGDPWSVDVLQHAAKRATERGDLELATSYLDRALGEPPATEQRAGVLVELAQAETKLGLPSAPGRFESAIDLLDDPVQQARNLGRLGQVRLTRGEHRLATAAFGQGLALLDDREAELALQLDAGLMAARRFHAGSVRPGRDRPAVDAEDAEDPDLTPGRQALLAQMAYDQALSPEGTADEAARLAVTALGGDPSAPEVIEVDDTAFFMAVKALIYSDRLDDADLAVDRSLDDTRQRESPVLAARNSHLRASIMFRRGRVPEAMVHAQESLDAADAGWLVVTPSAVACLACCHLERGETKLAAQVLADLPGGEEPWFRSGPCDFYLYAKSQLLVAEGRDPAALEALKMCGQHAEKMSSGKLSSNPWRSAAALVASRLGDADQAHRWVDEELEQARSFGARRAIGIALRASAALMTGRKRLDLLEDAADILRASPGVLELARVLVELGAELENRHDGDHAGRASIQEGLELADRCGATLLAKQARSQLREAGARPRKPVRLGLDALSPGERRVADLACRGMTNREISETLVVTRKAVEWHLNRAFKKLGITSRQELASAMARR